MKSVLYFELLKLKIQHIFTKFYEYSIYVIFFVQLKKKKQKTCSITRRKNDGNPGVDWSNGSLALDGGQKFWVCRDLNDETCWREKTQHVYEHQRTQYRLFETCI